MKVICTQEKIKKAIFNTEKITGKHTSLPILGNILIETETGGLKFSATNLEIGIISKINAKIEREGRITVPAKLISNFVGNLPSEENIEMEVDGSVLTIHSGKYRAEIKGMDSEDFPLIPKSEDEKLFSVPAQKLRDMLSRVLVCVASNETRLEFTGANMIFFRDSINLVATDSFRLAEASVALNKNEKQDKYNSFISKTSSLIIPAATLFEVVRVIDTDSEKVDISIGEGQVFISIDDVSIVSRLISGKFPDYKQIIPGEFSTRLVGKKDDISRAIKLASIFTEYKSGEVEIKVEEKEKKMLISSKSFDSGENKTEVSVDITGPRQEVILNPRYLLDGIGTMPGSQIAMLINNDFSPVGFRAIDEKSGKVIEDYIYIVMPVKK